MTRNELVKVIFDSSYCPNSPCGLPEAEGNTGECCLKCANDVLKEYEQTIRNKAIDECIRLTEETVWKDADMLADMFRELKEEE